MKIRRFILDRIKSFRTPLWLRWSRFPKDGAPPTLSIFEIVLYLLAFLICGYLFWAFNKIPNSTFIIKADKLTNERRITSDDDSYHLHFQVADIIFRIPRNTLFQQDTVEIFSSKFKEDSIRFYIPREITDAIVKSNPDSLNIYIPYGLSPYWSSVIDRFSKYCDKEEVRYIGWHHLNYKKNSSTLDLSNIISHHESYRFPHDRLKVANPNNWKHRYYIGFAINTNIKEEKVNDWKDNWDDGKETFTTYQQEIKKEGTAYYHWHNSYSASYHNEIECYYRIYDGSSFNNKVNIQSPGWFELYDISQGWYEIKFETATIDSLSLTIDFIGATDFYPMKIEPDEKGSNYIKFTDPLKILQIRKEGLRLYAQFKELENRQTIRCFAVTAILSGLIIVFITFFILGLYRGIRSIRDVSNYDDMQKWLAYTRRHNANVFDVFFKDKENISDKDIVSTIKDVAEFFSLPVPTIQNRCETIAQIMTSKEGTECELFYDWKLMEKAGINNVDTLRLSFVHELAHETLFQKRFLLFENELWVQELAADMIVGAFSTIGSDVATGKYKYVLAQLPASITHPDGKLRAAIVEFGRDYAAKLKQEQKLNDIKDVLTGLPAFVYGHYKELQEAWDMVRLEDVGKEGPIVETPIDYESLPDTNLLKQYYMKHKKDKEDEI